VPDPQAKTTFAASRLTWSWESDQHKSRLRRLYQDLLRTRHEWPALRDYSQRSARMLPETQSGVILELVRGGGGVRTPVDTLLQSHQQPQTIPFQDLATKVCVAGSRGYMACDGPIRPASVCCRECMVFRFHPRFLTDEGTQMPQEIRVR
jgi:hypothetical protein